MIVKAIYRIPEIRHVFLIVSHIDQSLMEDCEMTKQAFEYILLGRHYIKGNTKGLQWTMKLIQEIDFLNSMKMEPMKESELSLENQSSLELLSMNLSKTDMNFSQELTCTCKKLSQISEEDIIEVFV